jgi:hypothetical protein
MFLPVAAEKKERRRGEERRERIGSKAKGSEAAPEMKQKLFSSMQFLARDSSQKP